MEGTYFFGEYLRWNLGWSNPNQAGVFIAMWIPWLWCLAVWAGGKGRANLSALAVIGIEFGLWFLLCKTYSRGALVAVAVAAVVYGIWYLTRRDRAAGVLGDMIPIAVRVAGVGVILAATGFFSRIDPRYVSQDASAGNRLALWKGGLQMIAESPWKGWGAGMSGSGFMHWYQPLDAKEGYAGMVNSYLHVGVERGLPLLMAVVTVIAAIWLLSLWQSRAAAGKSMWISSLVMAAGGSWMVFAIANVFSTLWIFHHLWWLPAAAGVVVLAEGICSLRRSFLPAAGKCLSAGAVVAILLGSVIWICGKNLHDGIHISISLGEEMICCQGKDETSSDMLFFPDKTVLGETWGKEIRRLAGHHEDLRLLVPRLESLAGKQEGANAPQRIVACGGKVADGLAASVKFPDARLILVHPLGKPVMPSGAVGEIVVILPALDTQGTGRTWKSFCRKQGWKWIQSPGVGQDVRMVWPQVMDGVM